MNNLLHMLVGSSNSGKTTFRKKNLMQYPTICPDDIRLAIHGKVFDVKYEPKVWETAKTMVKSLFLSGHTNVVLDATNTTTARRSDWKEFNRIFYIFDTPENICIQRALKNNREDLIPIIQRMHKNFEPVKVEEGPYIKYSYSELINDVYVSEITEGFVKG